MVNHCVLCRQKAGDKALSFHRFPILRPEVLQKWVEAVDVEGFQPTRNHRVCSAHFKDEDFYFAPGPFGLGPVRKHLKDDALPTLFLGLEDRLLLKTRRKKRDLNPEIPHKSAEKPNVKPAKEITDSLEEAGISDNSQSNFFQPKVLYQVTQENIIQQVNIENISYSEKARNSSKAQCIEENSIQQVNIENTSYSENSSKPQCIDNQVTQQYIIQLVDIEDTPFSEKAGQVDNENTSYSEKARNSSKTECVKYRLRRKIKDLQAQLRRRDKKISKMKALISNLKSKRTEPKTWYQGLEDHLSGFPLEVVLNHLKNKSVAKSRMSYTPLMKQFALTLYCHSPKAYEYIRSLIDLPHKSRIKYWISSAKSSMQNTIEVEENLLQSTVA